MELRIGIEVEAAGARRRARVRRRRFAGSCSACDAIDARRRARRGRDRRGLRLPSHHRGRHRATRSSRRFWSISAASSFRARPSAAGQRCRSGAYTRALPEASTATSCDAIRDGAVRQGARGHAPPPDSTAATATASSRPSCGKTCSSSVSRFEEASCKKFWSRAQRAASAAGCASCSRPSIPDMRWSDLASPGRPARRRDVRAGRPRGHERGREGGRGRARASSISAAFPSKGRGRRSSTPISSAATTCSRPRAAPGSSASCSRRRTTPSASIRAHAGSASTSPCGPNSVTASARRSARRWARSMPTSTACASLPAHRQRRRHAGRQAPAVDLAFSRRTWPSSSASGSSIRTSATRSSTAPRTMRAAGGTTARLSLRLPAARPRRGPRRRGARRRPQAAARSGRRLVPGRAILQRRVRRRHRAGADVNVPEPVARANW